MDNAVKFSPEGGTVTVSARRRAATVEVSVVDEGIGIPSGEQKRIFQKFYRADSAPSREGIGGAGLGLFIARGLWRRWAAGCGSARARARARASRSSCRRPRARACLSPLSSG